LDVPRLENFIERSVILSRGPGLRAPLAELRADPAEAADRFTLEQVERNYILHVFRETHGVISDAATRLGVPRTTLNAMMKKLGISRSDL
jgi:formate hydrogenlyase transcriptional activator